MAYANTPRRSARLQNKEKILPKINTKTKIQKPRPQLIRKSPFVDLDAIDAHIAAQAKSPNRLVPSVEKLLRCTSASPSEASASDGSKGYSSESEGSEDAHSDPSFSSIDYITPSALSQHSVFSNDSRFEPENEDYDYDDGFVVNDDESVEMEGSDAASDVSDHEDLEINMERDPYAAEYQHTGRRVLVSSIFSEAGCRRVSSVLASPQTVRRASGVSGRSRRSSSGLFVSDRHRVSPVRYRLSPWREVGFQEVGEGDGGVYEPLIAQASAEVVEEITDALALFSRRVNRERMPVSMRLAAAVLEDGDIRDELEGAIRTGLGRKMSVADGSKRWTFGPKGR